MQTILDILKAVIKGLFEGMAQGLREAFGGSTSSVHDAQNNMQQEIDQVTAMRRQAEFWD